MRVLVATATALVALGAPAAANVLQQPNGAAIPSPMGCDSGHPTGLAPALACECDPSGACNIGNTCGTPGSCPQPSGACETTLWHEFNDNTCIPSHIAGL